MRVDDDGVLDCSHHFHGDVDLDGPHYGGGVLHAGSLTLKMKRGDSIGVFAMSLKSLSDVHDDCQDC